MMPIILARRPPSALTVPAAAVRRTPRALSASPLIVGDSTGALAAARELGGDRWAGKAQVHAGGRGKAGGIKLVASPEAVREAAAALLGSRLVTSQTGAEGKVVRRVYVEQATDHERELRRGEGRWHLVPDPDSGQGASVQQAATANRQPR